MAEQDLIKNKFKVRVMPMPSTVKEGCGFCLRLLPEELEKAALFLNKQGLKIKEAYMKEDSGALRKIEMEE